MQLQAYVISVRSYNELNIIYNCMLQSVTEHALTRITCLGKDCYASHIQVTWSSYPD
jgi:hypothetical protein